MNPIELPRLGSYHFVCINLVTGHVRNEKDMTTSHAILLNSYHHNRDVGYMWLWDDQYSFKDQLTESPDLVLSG